MESSVKLWIASALLRLALIAYGEWQDSHLEVPYSDVDYTVFSDAAAFMAQGRSPFLRDTYRYSPLLAMLLLPNVWIHRCWGKILFSVADLLTGSLIYRLLRLQGIAEGVAIACAAVFLLNPFTFTIGTRGNCEALPCAVVLWTLILLLQGRNLQAAFWYGLVVHFRIYPIIYALPFVLFLNARASETTSKQAASSKSMMILAKLVSRDSLSFGLTSGAVFLALTLASYALYGPSFLNEALLYHLTRTDPRHNFSIYFYSIYLRQSSSITLLDRLASFAPQMLVQTVFAAAYHDDLPLCLFAQTAAFVAFNKVVTAQYFVWFFSLLPLVLPFTGLKFFWGGSLCIGVWTLSQLHWLAWAYLLEFKGRNVFFQLWISSIVFFVANVFVLSMLLYHHHNATKEQKLKAI
ncbi:GPI mannosyltransferase 1-like [Selaginella moellendorffii]|uniref:GPI mannosyltransferase 1-like n=1 Tax=Selaginella moellendorffii TaxID=88036 RepID=UPI000D1CF03D|nr:GPI mannosyltransferase 1-like [Selaginella moellendorffii]|eukprot:XP_024519444.1 GPI mannosyltransferase 1-like [Selaginella moellendorffii]